MCVSSSEPGLLLRFGDITFDLLLLSALPLALRYIVGSYAGPLDPNLWEELPLTV
jgi:hypothetical protein